MSWVVVFGFVYGGCFCCIMGVVWDFDNVLLVVEFEEDFFFVFFVCFVDCLIVYDEGFVWFQIDYDFVVSFNVIEIDWGW